MLTSVESSQTSDFYQPSLCFSKSPCSIINGTDKSNLNDTEEWNDMDHLMDRSSAYEISTPNKINLKSTRRIFTNINSVSHDSSNSQDSKQLLSDRSRSSENSYNYFEDHNKDINNTWNISTTENQQCSKACVNVNMGYNEESSGESMVSNTIAIFGQESHAPTIEPVRATIKSDESLSYPVSDSDANELNLSSVSPIAIVTKETRIFKNVPKTGHSRQWGSCGSVRMLQLTFDDKALKSKLSLESALPVRTIKASPGNAMPNPFIAGARSTRLVPDASCSQNNRNSRVSCEVEYGCDGRTHICHAVDILNFDPLTMANQITKLEFSFFQKIKSEEFLSFKWTGLSKSIHAPGIVDSTRWFNQLNFWTQNVILSCHELVKRTEMLTYFIRVMRKLVENFNNLSSGMAIMSAIEMECIHRLKHTWNNLQNRDRITYRRMEELFSSENNYQKLREHIDSLKLPCIPYLGLYLTDLVYIQTAHSKLSEFESQTKTDQINNILRKISEFQQSEYEFVQQPNLIKYLENQKYIEELQKIIEDNLFKLSLTLEPNSNSSPSPPFCLAQDLQSNTPNSTPKIPPSYACMHPPTVMSLQSPISPKLMLVKGQDETVKDFLDWPDDNVEMTHIDCKHGDDLSAIDDDFGAEDTQGCDDSMIMESRYSDEDSVKVSLLCATSRKSQYQKRSNSTSIRFKRDSSSSSRQQVSSRTATLSSTSHSVVSGDQDLLAGHQPKSLLDGSYFDRTLNDSIGSSGQISSVSEMKAVTRLQESNFPLVPPICKCLLGKEEIIIKPRAKVDSLSPVVSRPVNPLFQHIADAAEQAAKFSAISRYFQPDLSTDPPIDMDQESLKLVCQGILVRKTCFKNGKKARFATWAKYWTVLLMSRDTAFLVSFESSHHKALERKDFKSNSCEVQYLKNVCVCCRRPVRNNKKISELKYSFLSDKSIVGLEPHDHNKLKKFFLIDKDYLTMFKFRDCSQQSRDHSSVTNNSASTVTATADDDTTTHVSSSSSSSNKKMPSTITWYRLLKRTVRDINVPPIDNTDLIVLSDT